MNSPNKTMSITNGEAMDATKLMDSNPSTSLRDGELERSQPRYSAFFQPAAADTCCSWHFCGWFWLYDLKGARCLKCVGLLARTRLAMTRLPSNLKALGIRGTGTC